MNLIDVDALKEKEQYIPIKHGIMFHGVTAAAIDAAPIVDARPVVHARWVKIYKDGEPIAEQPQVGVCCSKCLNMPKDKFTESKFCPNCGAIMFVEE